MKKIVLLLVFGFFIACSNSNEDEINPEVTHTLAVFIENEKFNIAPDKIFINENCDLIFISIYCNNLNDLGFKINFELYKSGVINKINLIDFRNSSKAYSTADFNANETFQISNFIYDSATNYLHFDFEGDLIAINNNYSTIDNSSERKFLRGQIDSKTIIETNCTEYFSDLNFNATNLTFHSNLKYSSQNHNTVTNPFTYYFYSDNGFKIVFKNSAKQFDLPINQYDFDENTIENRVDFEKYIGNIRATQLLFIRPIDWKNYQTSGNYKILEHTIVNGKNVTKGELNLNVYDNGNLLYEIKDAPFEIVDF